MKVVSLIFSTVLALTSVTVQGCGRYEFFQWNQLPDKIKAAAAGLGYDEMTWDNIQTNPIEFLNFEDVVSGIMDTEVTVGDVLANLESINLVNQELSNEKMGMCWDFYVNHYNGFTWDALQDLENPFGDNIGEMVKILGWNQEMWESDDLTGTVPESECKTWLGLDPTEKFALRSMGWNAAKWFASPCDPRCPTSIACPDN
eukprot:343594_1